ncbi:MAG: IS110 family transposase [Tannerellaceae bacterium]|nr:IS110 family transposase [Tannerellaceae bacterium]
MQKLVIGMDVSKEKLDVCLYDGERILQEKVIVNTLSSLQEYVFSVLRFYNLQPADLLICAEYTGHYIYPLCLLTEQGYKVWIENPSEIKYRSGVSRAKNDKIDARKIAFYGFRYQDRQKLYSLADRSLSRLKALTGERDLYVVDRAKYEAQLKDQKQFMAFEEYRQKKSRLEKAIGLLDELIDEIDRQLAQTIDENQVLCRQYTLLVSIVGVGARVATKMIIETNGFTDFENGRKFCSHAGVAPFEHTSGSSLKTRRRVSHRADKSIKTLLHMAAMAAIRTQGGIREYYLRKTAEGKAKMLVLNAIRAKLVLTMFAVIKNNKPYDKNYQFSFA